MGAHRFAWLDVFAESPLSGNPLAVVLDADGMTAASMQAFALETNLSETTFVQTPRQREAAYRNRIWTRAGEVPFAGHPSLGTAVAVAAARGETQGTYLQETLAGLQRVTFSLEGRRATASVEQEAPVFSETVAPERAMAALGLRSSDAAPSPCRVVSTGLPVLIVPVRTPEAVRRAGRDADALAALLGALPAGDVHNVYVAAVGATGDVTARCLFRDGGEDPATGSAAGALCAYTDRYLGRPRLRIRQGKDVGRPSLLHAELASGTPKVSGMVHLVAAGTVELD